MVENWTSDHLVPGSKLDVFMSGALSPFVALAGAWSVAKTLAVKKRCSINQFTHTHVSDAITFRRLQKQSRQMHLQVNSEG